MHAQTAHGGRAWGRWGAGALEVARAASPLVSRMRRDRARALVTRPRSLTVALFYRINYLEKDSRTENAGILSCPCQFVGTILPLKSCSGS